MSGFQASLGSLEAASSQQATLTKKEAQSALRSYLASPEFEELWALVGVAHYGQLVGVSLTDQELTARAEFFRKHFSVPFHLILTLLKGFIGQSGLNLASARRNRGNYLWDAGICYMIPTAATAGVTIQLVTGDQAIAAAAIDAQSGTAVVKLEEYLQRIGLP